MKYISIIFIFFIIISCENNVEEEIVEMENQCNPDISFLEIVKPIIDNNCVQCHQGNRFPDLRTQQSINENASIIKEQVQSRQMPIGNSLPQTDVDAIVCWIENGALNN